MRCATGITIGIDVGAVSVKLAAVGAEQDAPGFLEAPGEEFFYLRSHPRGCPILLSRYRRLRGDPAGTAKALIKTLVRSLAPEAVTEIRVTGSGASLVADRLGARVVNEFTAIAQAAVVLSPGVRSVFEMGGEAAKFIRLGERGEILDYETNGDCAAGTGSFIDQQAARLRCRVEEVGPIALGARSAARIAGRCSVFAKSDMIHAQQKGYGPPEILRGLADAVARNFKGSITKGKLVVPPVAFIGGLAANRAVVEALQGCFRLGDGLFVPEAYAWFGAVGAALPAPRSSSFKSELSYLGSQTSPNPQFPTHPRLSLEHVTLLRDRIKPYRFPEACSSIDVFLGIDVGSVSTNFALLDETHELVEAIYVRTEGRPIEVVGAGLRAIREEFGDRIRVRGVGTTGSGRELIGELVGADAVKDEITAHKTGAMHVSRLFNLAAPDTIFEIGGQDSKFVQIDGGVVVDFTMNEACAAGTGSFLEEQAERLGVAIVGEFSHLALSSPAPVRLGERCTVFMEREVNTRLNRGAGVRDLVAGLAYSIALNYLNRVVRGRKVGRVIYFQGGTAYNDAVAAAFAGLLGRPVIVPPHNGVIGAVGAALLAKESVERPGRAPRFRGFDVKRVSYRLREFVCKACPNLCDMQEFTVEGVKTYWGDKCSWKFRRRAKTEREPLIADLVELRDRLCWGPGEPRGDGPRIGAPRAMSFYDDFPFWRTLLEALGARVVPSDPTNRAVAQDGIDLAVAEPCYPAEVAHGHLMDLVKKGVDAIFLPNVLNVEAPTWTSASHLCPWNQTLPFVLRAVSCLEPWRHKLLTPTVRFRDGERSVKQALSGLFRFLGASRRQAARALELAYEVRRAFIQARLMAGRRALELLDAHEERGIILTGRAYTLYDLALNLDVPGKLRDHYGVNVIPLDFLPLDEERIADINDNMYWNSGRRILAAARIAGRHPRLDLIHLTHFKCGPDSYIKHFIGAALGKPFLTLSFDGHGNDAGIMTRCEAYLESKGILGGWKPT
ncbi:MAG: acyl-CoA dehydratase activase [Candidatus Methylomirabilia bacterium]